MLKRLEIAISGKVQGIFFRQFIKENAVNLKLNGFVENKANGTVKVIAEGEEDNLQKLIESCKIGPKLARIDDLKISWSKPTNEFQEFIIKY
ncbi:MAG: acylphosphatase [Patescibacteria group bacterium]|nr:acylphosphatase [Patescibacteria group bacterium]